MNWKTWLPLVLAAILGLLAAKAGRNVLLRAQKAAIPTGKFAPTIVANADLPPGSSLGESDLATVQTPADSLPRSAFQKTTDLVGRVLVQPVVKGQTILESFLAPTGSAAGPQALVPNGMRALTIEINEASGVAGLLVPGCHVDAVSTIQDDTQNQAVARTIVENATVLAVGQHLQTPAKKEQEENARAKSVTLLVAPRDAEALELAASTGKLRLVLRSSMDNSKSPSTGLTIAELLGRQSKIPDVVVVQAPPPPPKADIPKTTVARTIEIIRNGKVERVEVPITPLQQPNALTGDSTQASPVVPDRSP